MKSIVFALAIAVVVAEESPLQPYVSPFQFCKELPAGRYCNGKFSRGFVTCPTSLEEFCPQNTVCSAGPTLGTVQCVPNLWKPIPRMCEGKPPLTSYCFQNMTVQCPSGDAFLCPPDLECQRRGRRAFCVQPRFIENGEPSLDQICEAAPQGSSVCHPTNLKKIVSCPGKEVTFCPLGQMCDNDNPSDPTSAACKPIESNPARWCSNKPVMSSFCVPKDQEAKLVLCSLKPQILQCPTGKCVQELSITSRCV